MHNLLGQFPLNRQEEPLGSHKDNMVAACQAEEEADRGKGIGGPGAGKGFAFLAEAVGASSVIDLESDDEGLKSNLIKFLFPGDYHPKDLRAILKNWYLYPGILENPVAICSLNIL